MAGDRAKRKREQARRDVGPAARDTEAAEQLLTQIASVATAAAKPLLPPAAVPCDAAAVAEGVRALALHVMQRSTLNGKHECRAGCACCCHTAVTVAAPEVFAIAQRLRETLVPAELESVRTRLRENAARAASCTREEYIAALIPCGLLTADGNCRAHRERPLACAGFLSTSRAACEAKFAGDEEGPPLPIDRFTLLVGLGASYGLRDACKTAGVDSQFYELHHALLRVLDAPDAAEQWARGEPVFSGCLT